MKRVLMSGDHHWDEHSRFDECRRIHDWMVQGAEDLNVDLFLSGGDVFHSLSTPKERDAVSDWLRAMAEVCPVLISKGNHDRPIDLALMSKLESEHEIVVEEGARVHYFDGGDVAVAAMSWPNTATLAAATGAVGADATTQIAQEAYRGILSGICQEWAAHNGPRVLLGHFMIDGSKTSTGQPMVGAALNVGLADLALSRANIALCSHIHLAQEWQYGDMDIVMAGSPRRTDFGEMEDKSVVLVEIEHGELRWSRIPTPCTPMVLIEARWNDERLDITSKAFPHQQRVNGAEVKLRVTTTSDARDAAKVAASELRDKMIADGALMVRVEEVVETTTRARAPEVAAATTLDQKLKAYWAAKGIVLGDREPRVLSRLGELEGTCA